MMLQPPVPEVTLLLGGGVVERVIDDATTLLWQFRSDADYAYMDYESLTPRDTVVPEDLAVTLLVNSRVTGKTFQSIQRHGPSVDLTRLPDTSLERSTPEERARLAAFLAEIASWEGFATSVTTKILHKKRPALIPILDNQAIFGAYRNPVWPGKAAAVASIKNAAMIREALDCVYFDLTRPENQDTWAALSAQEPTRSRVQLFNSVWWGYFLAHLHRA